MVLINQEATALFVWRKFIDKSGQQGINCAVFRNESGCLSSELIIEAEEMTVLITEPLSPESKEKLVGFGNKQVTAENRAVQADLRETAEEIANLEIAIDNETADLDDIAEAQDRGLFIGREQKRVQLTKAWQARQERPFFFLFTWR